jgi:hypothetical protein
MHLHHAIAQQSHPQRVRELVGVVVVADDEPASRYRVSKGVISALSKQIR